MLIEEADRLVVKLADNAGAPIAPEVVDLFCAYFTGPVHPADVYVAVETWCARRPGRLPLINEIAALADEAQIARLRSADRDRREAMRYAGRPAPEVVATAVARAREALAHASATLPSIRPLVEDDGDEDDELAVSTCG